MLFGQEHVRRYLETDGAEGHDWQGTTVLILTTTGRRSGEPRSTPLIYGKRGDDHMVVASKGGAEEHPAIPAGTATRFEPGQSRTVRLVALAGKREVFGFRQEVMGKV